MCVALRARLGAGLSGLIEYKLLRGAQLLVAFTVALHLMNCNSENAPYALFSGARQVLTLMSTCGERLPLNLCFHQAMTYYI